MKPSAAIEMSHPIHPVSRISLLTLTGRMSALGDVAIKRELDLCAQWMANLDRNGGARHGGQSTVTT